MQKRSVATVVILSIITCGIYTAVVSYMILNDMEREGAKSKVPAWAVLLLMLLGFTSSVGGALLGYVADDSLNQLREARGQSREDNMVLWLVLGIFFPVITLALIQNSINNTLDGAAV